MNLVELATELEYVPKEQLAQMSQDPNNRFPQYLVLSEIQRRTANEKAYAAAQPQPTTTIAEEVVGEFMQPKGLQAGMPSVSAPTDVFSTESMSMPASAPMQQPMMGMASGGLTAYANGGSLEQSFADPYTNVLGSSTNPYPVDDEASFLEDRYLDEEGNIRYGRALGDATFAIPLGAGFNIAGRLGLAGIRRFAPNIIEKTKGLFTSANPALANLKVGQRKVKTDKGYDTINTATGKKIPEQLFDAKKSLSAISYPAAATTLLSRAVDDGDKPTNTETEVEEQLRLQRKAYEKQLAELRNKATGTAKPKKEIDYDLVGLGGLIMGSRNMSDLGMGLAGLAESKQNRQAAKEKLDLERQLTEAQVMSLKGKSKYADTEALQSYLTAKKQQISDQLDSGLLSQERAAKELEKLAPAEARLIQMYEMLFGGIANSANSDEDFLKSLSA